MDFYSTVVLLGICAELAGSAAVRLDYFFYGHILPRVSINQVISRRLGEELFINIGNTSALGMVTSEGFVVLKGAVVNEKASAKSLSAGIKQTRAFKVSI